MTLTVTLNMTFYGFIGLVVRSKAIDEQHYNFQE
jgi:hypothetical protein